MSVYLKDSLEAYAVGPCRLDTWRTHDATVSTAAAADRPWCWVCTGPSAIPP